MKAFIALSLFTGLNALTLDVRQDGAVAPSSLAPGESGAVSSLIDTPSSIVPSSISSISLPSSSSSSAIPSPTPPASSLLPSSSPYSPPSPPTVTEDGYAYPSVKFTTGWPAEIRTGETVHMEWTGGTGRYDIWWLQSWKDQYDCYTQVRPLLPPNLPLPLLFPLLFHLQSLVARSRDLADSEQQYYFLRNETYTSYDFYFSTAGCWKRDASMYVSFPLVTDGTMQGYR